MADLDDFFAKKDKKKSKAKPKFPVAEETKNHDDTKRSEHAAEVEKKTETDDHILVTNDSEPPPQPQTNIEDEWKDFEEEHRKDYTGLKIGQLRINDDDDPNMGSNGDDDEFDSDDNVTNEKGRHDGLAPWKKLIPAEEVTQIPMEPEKPSSKVYISPALRAAQNQGIAPRPKTRRTAPDITNADYFPSLDAARPDRQKKKKNEPAFEEVKHGGRIHRIDGQQTAAQQPAVETNRFQSLGEEDS